MPGGQKSSGRRPRKKQRPEGEEKHFQKRPGPQAQREQCPEGEKKCCQKREAPVSGGGSRAWQVPAVAPVASGMQTWFASQKFPPPASLTRYAHNPKYTQTQQPPYSHYISSLTFGVYMLRIWGYVSPFPLLINTSAKKPKQQLTHPTF